jgi:hypothetical protein
MARSLTEPWFQVFIGVRAPRRFTLNGAIGTRRNPRGGPSALSCDQMLGRNLIERHQCRHIADGMYGARNFPFYASERWPSVRGVRDRHGIEQATCVGVPCVLEYLCPPANFDDLA